ncbi:unnamed protein product [Eruca vesicaria subsp. sativa]|uniref:Uncharacterized protein n=1 Tax=Eruca vesicaria subsp. sativa TaxID=29727 RepID=A0ABC8JAQ6_ERUVS|nr:unnamed protein product [Eruca vesicaria subsp. sativa]
MEYNLLNRGYPTYYDMPTADRDLWFHQFARKENSEVPVDDSKLLRSTYTNKKTGEIQDPVIKEVLQLVESRKEEILSTQASMCEDGSCASSNTIIVEQLNNLVLEVHLNFFWN